MKAWTRIGLIALAFLLFALLACGSVAMTEAECDRASTNKAIEFAQEHPTCTNIDCDCGRCWCVAWATEPDYDAKFED